MSEAEGSLVIKRREKSNGRNYRGCVQQQEGVAEPHHALALPSAESAGQAYVRGQYCQEYA